MAWRPLARTLLAVLCGGGCRDRLGGYYGGYYDDYYPYVDDTYYVDPDYVDPGYGDDGVAYCIRRFRTYDQSSGTYVGMAAAGSRAREGRMS